MRLRTVGIAVAVLALGGVSAWSVLAPTGLGTGRPEVAETIAGNADTAVTPPATDAGPSASLPTTTGQSGANVQKQVHDDGSTVTKFTPKTREGDGPAFIEVGSTRGQDARTAAFPNENLLEDSPQGRLPVIGPDGLRPMDQYARPWSGTRANRIAIVVGGLGLSQTGSQKAIRNLPGSVTLGFAATGNSLQRWMQEARRDGHEILLQVPLEPFDYPDNDPGPRTLRVGVEAARNLDVLHASMAEITNYTGIMNYLGGRFLSDADALEPVMRDLSKRGLLFLDDGTSGQSLSGTVAGAVDVPHGFADMVLDGQLNESAILRKLDDLERIARKNGSAIGVASAFDESIAAISKWISEAEGRGIEFVGVSALVKDPRQQ